MKKHLPNLLTCGNLLSGCLGIFACFESQLSHAFYFILLAAAFDFFDGFLARLLKVSGEMGKELDSLADMVSFGVLPATIMYHLMATCTIPYLPYLALIIAAFSALRLAKFNIDTRQSESFIGVPTTANAPLLGSLPLIIEQKPEWAFFLQNCYVLAGLCVLMSILLVSELPLIAIKFKHYAWKGNEFKYLLIVSAIILVLAFQVAAIPLIIFLYIILSSIQNQLKKRTEA